MSQTHTQLLNYSACDLACWSTTTPACYRAVAWGSFCFMRSSQEIPTPDWVCMSVFQTCCYPTVCMSACRYAANKRGRGLHGAGTKQQRLPGVCMCVCAGASQYHWPLSAEENENVCTCNSSSLYPLWEKVCMCVCSLSVTMCLPLGLTDCSGWCTCRQQKEAAAHGQMQARSVEPQSKTNKRWTDRVKNQWELGLTVLPLQQQILFCSFLFRFFTLLTCNVRDNNW